MNNTNSDLKTLTKSDLPGIRKRAYNRTIKVLTESLVERFGINEGTWFDEVATEDGILLRICSLEEATSKK